jgi:TetR/AcrR family transcriptional regulator, cholesterol catabolism regulator
MPRVIKHPDVRRAELVDRAFELFLQKGYEHVSIDDLTKDAGVSKGAFYHWFPSRDALIEALADRSARQALTAVEGIAAECRGAALERLNTVLQASFDVKIAMKTPESLAAMHSLLRPGNAHLYGRIVAKTEEVFGPFLARLIADGVAEGVFDTFDPEGVADMIQGFAARSNANVLAVLDTAGEARQDAISVLTTRFRFHALAIDRILGLPDGSIRAITHEQVETLFAATPPAHNDHQ